MSAKETGNLETSLPTLSCLFAGPGPKRELRNAYWLATFKKNRELGVGEVLLAVPGLGGNEAILMGSGLGSLF